METFTNVLEREAEQTPTPTPTRTRRKRQPKRPSVQVFTEIVMRHCNNMRVSTVEGLCTQQAEALISELAEHFG